MTEDQKDARIAELTRQRDELLAALEELDGAIEDGLCNAGSPGFDRTRLDRAQFAARAAIASVEGSK